MWYQNLKDNLAKYISIYAIERRGQSLETGFLLYIDDGVIKDMETESNCVYVNKIIEFDYSLVYMQNDNNLNISIHWKYSKIYILSVQNCM